LLPSPNAASLEKLLGLVGCVSVTAVSVTGVSNERRGFHLDMMLEVCRQGGSVLPVA
jgi:hypothetical protein